MGRRLTTPRQLEFDFEVPQERDRNFHLGGRSFYFFDLDDNILFLSTPIVIFHKNTGEEYFLSSADFSKHNRDVGKSGPFADYFFDFKDDRGSFRYFRDKNLTTDDLAQGKCQRFVEDIQSALKEIDGHWKAPSWNFFFHATYNQRPISIITARGHHPETIKQGINQLVTAGHLPHNPHYHGIFPVSHQETRLGLGDYELKMSIAELKKEAIRKSVKVAIEKYGYSPFHRFGMSDDDQHNIELITEEMRSLKKEYPEMSFFVIQTFKNSYTKREILADEVRAIISKKESTTAQLSLFE